MTAENLPLLLQLVNVLIVPVAVYVVRIDRRMGQIDALSTVNQGRIEKLEQELKTLTQTVIRIEFQRSV
jgi:hypothetical protein